jgi:hypothetical protein
VITFEKNQRNSKMATRGGKRPGAGRPAKSKDRATLEEKVSLEALARQHTKAALDTLALIATKGESEAARVSAANALLDRGYGRPRQAVEVNGNPDSPVHHEVTVTFVRPKK